MQLPLACIQVDAPQQNTHPSEPQQGKAYGQAQRSRVVPLSRDQGPATCAKCRCNHMSIFRHSDQPLCGLHNLQAASYPAHQAASNSSIPQQSYQTACQASCCQHRSNGMQTHQKQTPHTTTTTHNTSASTYVGCAARWHVLLAALHCREPKRNKCQHTCHRYRHNTQLIAKHPAR